MSIDELREAVSNLVASHSIGNPYWVGADLSGSFGSAVVVTVGVARMQFDTMHRLHVGLRAMLVECLGGKEWSLQMLVMRA